MSISESQKKYLRGLGHKIKPIIMIGHAGLSESVQKEFESAISHHELIKVQIRAGDREARDSIINEICNSSDSSLVTRIGNIALVYRRNDETPSIVLPKS